MFSFKKWIESTEPKQATAIDFAEYDLQKKYAHYNQLLFGGELPEIPITFAKLKGIGGVVHFKVVMDPRNLPHPMLVRRKLQDKYHGGKILPGSLRMEISNTFKKSEAGLDAILVHEMIHVYFAAKGNLSEDHGVKFIRMARELSVKAGFEVPLTDKADKLGLTDESKLKTVGIQINYRKDGTHTVCVMNPKTIEANLPLLIKRWQGMSSYSYSRCEFYMATTAKGTGLAMTYPIQRKAPMDLTYYRLQDLSVIEDMKANAKLLAVVEPGVEPGVAESVLPRRKECSAVAIQAITGEPVDDIERTLPTTIFEIEDRGFVRDLSPTKIWAGKPVRDLRAGSNIKLGLASIKQTSEHEAHVMPIINGQLLNAAGWFDEPIAVVVAFKKKAGT